MLCSILQNEESNAKMMPWVEIGITPLNWTNKSLEMSWNFWQSLVQSQPEKPQATPLSWIVLAFLNKSEQQVPLES